MKVAGRFLLLLLLSPTLPAALEQLLKTEIGKWDQIIRDAGITPQ
jgi:hypothetical protein